MNGAQLVGSHGRIRQLRERFRAGLTLSDADRSMLIEIIEKPESQEELSEAVYLFSYSFPVDETVRNTCLNEILQSDSPDVVSECIKALFYNWSLFDESAYAEIERLALTKDFDELFDVYQVVLRIYNDNLGDDRFCSLKHPLQEFVRWGRSRGYDLELKSQ
jgi:hypothetical protein